MSACPTPAEIQERADTIRLSWSQRTLDSRSYRGRAGSVDRYIIRRPGGRRVIRKPISMSRRTIMRPNKPGEWHNSTGRKIVVYRWDILWYRPIDGDKDQDCIAVEDLPGNDWLPALPPLFTECPAPPMPEPPKFLPVLVNVQPPEQPQWRFVFNGAIYFANGDPTECPPYSYTVVPHPDNNPEAERLILQSAKKI